MLFIIRSSTMKSIIDLIHSNNNFDGHEIHNSNPLTPSKSFGATVKQSAFTSAVSATKQSQNLINAQSFQDVYNKNSRSKAQLIYDAHYSGLESVGSTGMTVLEELIDIALRECESNNGRRSNGNALRGAAVLSSNGTVYTGCDVFIGENDQIGISAEKSALLSAVADGITKFQCLVIASDTSVEFPTPNGQIREFLRSFGIYPVVLVNSTLECKHTSTQELVPMSLEQMSNSLNPHGKQDLNKSFQSASSVYLQDENVSTGDDDVINWNSGQVLDWLNYVGLNKIKGLFFHLHI